MPSPDEIISLKFKLFIMKHFKHKQKYLSHKILKISSHMCRICSDVSSKNSPKLLQYNSSNQEININTILPSKSRLHSNFADCPNNFFFLSDPGY